MQMLREIPVNILRFAVTYFLKGALSILCRVDSRSLSSIPRRGPLIIVTNHINFLEVPLIYAFLFPRRVIGLAKRETWDNPVLGFLGNLWEAIPLERGKSDIEALSKANEVLKRGGILAIAPEGTRSGDGRLRRGHPGVVTIASISGAPIIALAHWGGERFWPNLRSLRRTRITMKAGTPFRLDGDGRRITHERRAELADGVMNKISVLMPREYRGAYPEPEKAAGHPA
jgi:1-acyl-sn-glycerol-3-phosphate acyltransferase